MTAPSAVFSSTQPHASPTYIPRVGSHLDESNASLNHRDSDTTSLKDDFASDTELAKDVSEINNDPQRKQIQINLNLLVYKVFYFLFYGAVGSLLPYLAVFYKQLYLSAQQVGFLIGIRPFIQMSTGPLWGALADTYNVKKGILLTSLFSWLITNYSVSFVRIPPETACSPNISLIKLPEVGKVIPGSNTDYMRKAKYRSKLPKPYMKHTFQNYFWSPIFSKVGKRKRKPRHRRKAANDTVYLLLIAEIDRSKLNQSSKPVTMEEYKTSMMDFVEKSARLRIRRNIERKSEILSIQPPVKTKMKNANITKNNTKGSLKKTNLPIERLLAAEQLEEEFDSLNTDEEYPWPLDNIETTRNGELKEARKNSKNIFIVLIVITIFGTVLASPAATLADTATLENLKENTYAYGYQRLWGATGWGLCAFIVGIIVSSVQKSECEKGRHVDYILSFYVYAVMMALAILCAAAFKFNPVEAQSAYTDSLWEAICLFSDCQHGCFVVTLLTSGAAMGFIHTFLFWHLHDLGGTQLLFSVISGIQCVSEVLTYLISGCVISHIGCDNLFYIGLSANIFRMLAYSIITNPMFSIPLEILQGISSASIWTAAICYVGLIPGIPVTLQAMLHGVYWGLGHGGGGIIGGVMVTYIGSNSTFIVLSIICVINFVVLISLKYKSKVMAFVGNYTHVENIRAGTYILTPHAQNN